MKLVMIIAGDEYANEITSILVENNYGSTNIGSSGDFLQYGYTVLLLGVSDGDVERLINLIKGKGQENAQHYDYRDEVSIYVLNVNDHKKMHKLCI